MTALPSVAPTTTGRAHDEIVHFWCCSKAVAWCGADIRDERDCPDDCGCTPCVVCTDLADDDCPFGCTA